MTQVTLGPLHPRHGVHDPTSGSPARTPGSVRRTATTDILRPEGLTGPLLLLGRARDLVTTAQGRTEVAGTAATRLRIDLAGGRTVQEITTEPDRPALQALVGVRAPGGFRSAALTADPGLVDEAGLLHLLVDDVPVATLVSGHAQMAGTPAEQRSPTGVPLSYPQADQCAGFAREATFLGEIARTGVAPVVTGPAALPLVDGDPLAWHALDPLPLHAMRRSRRIDVRAGTTTLVDVLFRDSYVRPDGLETVIHEYTVAMEMADGLVVGCEATPRVLPWTECPAAAASAGRLVGQPVTGLRGSVRAAFRGSSTCTHLNDTLRSLEDVPALLSLVS